MFHYSLALIEKALMAISEDASYLEESLLASNL